MFFFSVHFFAVSKMQIHTEDLLNNWIWDFRLLMSIANGVVETLCTKESVSGLELKYTPMAVFDTLFLTVPEHDENMGTCSTVSNTDPFSAGIVAMNTWTAHLVKLHST